MDFVCFLLVVTGYNFQDWGRFNIREKGFLFRHLFSIRLISKIYCFVCLHGKELLIKSYISPDYVPKYFASRHKVVLLSHLLNLNRDTNAIFLPKNIRIKSLTNLSSCSSDAIWKENQWNIMAPWNYVLLLYRPSVFVPVL
jgi:hypothetical protein